MNMRSVLSSRFVAEWLIILAVAWVLAWLTLEVSKRSRNAVIVRRARKIGIFLFSFILVVTIGGLVVLPFFSN